MSQVNHNYDYVYSVDGFTPWERLRVIRNFLNDRRKALRIARLGQEKFEATKATMDEWERREAEIMNEDQESLIQDCVDEIEFLEKFEAELVVLAEAERIEGKTDREMYELNYAKEARARMAFQANSEVLTIGSVTPETMRAVLRDPQAVQLLLAQGVINPDALPLFERATPQLTLVDSKEQVG
jgi:hypothetical protein